MPRWFSVVGDRNAPGSVPEETAEALRVAAQRFDEVVVAARRAAEEIAGEARDLERTSDFSDAISREMAAQLLETLAGRADAMRREAEGVSRTLARAADQLGSSARSADEPAETDDDPATERRGSNHDGADRPVQPSNR